MRTWDFLAMTGFVAWASVITWLVMRVTRQVRGLWRRLRWALSGWRKPYKPYPAYRR